MTNDVFQSVKPVFDAALPGVYIETYGCQMNVNDSEVVLSILQKAGYSLRRSMGEANVILINTCAIRDNAEQRILGRLDVFRLEKKKRKGIVVGVLGCMAERLKEKLLEHSVVDLVAGPDAYRDLPRLLAACTAGPKQINTILSHEETYAEISPVRMDSNGVGAYISIMRGCNNVCSYCVVPYTRGAERSRDPETIMNEARELFANGYKEINLLGQNVDSYRWQQADGSVYDFADLIEDVASIDPSLRIRYSTSHPKDMSDKLLLAMAAHPNICRHIHLPVQSGSNVMLEKMRRRHTREWYLQRIARIREIMPDCAISTDVIAGFSGETEQDHLDTLDLFRQVGFDAAFMFQYSERPGTLASRHYPDDIPNEVKTARLNEIIALQNTLSLESNRRDVGHDYQVLIEGFSKRSTEDLVGRTPQNKTCVFKADGVHHTGDYVMVHVDDCTSATLLCTIIR
ncbi:MAG: tRNA (N6-isopentenyl adenosine(37)-C2)-methylthiotransferase MiaB [Bacteroidales bacterium]|nr:tRNA (N6-isopentenyl adenosine(37)-C2)-methylthiotransferase MiaB [Bacteroidales bacterium]